MGQRRRDSGVSKWEVRLGIREEYHRELPAMDWHSALSIRPVKELLQ